MRLRLLFLLPVLIFAALLAVFLWRLGDAPEIRGGDSPLIGMARPDFDLASPLPGLPGLRAADLDGKVVILNFFASWCAPCRAEHPLLMDLAKTGKTLLVGIAFQDKPADSAAFLAELGNPFANLGADEAGRTGIAFGISGVPETFIIDAKGIIRYRLAQPLTPDRLRQDILPLLEELSR